MKFPRYSMRFYPGFVPPLCLAVALTACSPAGEPQGPATAADLAAINGVHDEYFSAMNSGDAAGYVARLTEDVVFMPPNEQATIGKEANRARIQRAFDQAEFEMTSSLEEVVIFGNWAFGRNTASGTATPKAGGESREIGNKGILIFQRQPDGSWKIARRIRNNNHPPADPGQ